MNPNFIGIHGLLSHWSGEQDIKMIAAGNPKETKVVLVDTKIPGYVIELARAIPQMQFSFRHHPSSELNGTRGLTRVGRMPDLSGLSDTDKIKAYFKTVDWKEGEPKEGKPAWGFRAAWHRANLNSVQKVKDVAQYQAYIMTEICNNFVAAGLSFDRIAGGEGINEPEYWASEAADIVCDLECERTRLLTPSNIPVRAFGSGVGWPPDGGYKDSPVQWGFMKPWVDMKKPLKSAYHSHEYYSPTWTGPQQGYGWYVGRTLTMPYKIPIAITECGADSGVSGTWYGGWMDLPGRNMDDKAIAYVQHLVWMAQKYLADGRVVTMLPFTYDISSAHWEKFNVRNEVFQRHFVEYLTAHPLPDPAPSGPVVIPKPPPVVVPPDDDWDVLWDAFGQKRSFAFPTYAQAHDMGGPVTRQIEKNGYTYQGYAGGRLRCKTGEWSKIEMKPW